MLQTQDSNRFQTAHHYCDCTDVVDEGFRFAYQPIIQASTQQVVGHEALVRGLDGESAATVIAAISNEHQYAFDQACRARALQTAAQLGFEGDLHLNCSQITADNIAVAVAATRQCALDEGLDPARIVLEFANLELLGNPRQLDKARKIAQSAGFRVLADNVGNGEVCLKRLAVFRPDFAKLDRSLIDGIQDSPRRQAIVHGLIATCKALGIEVIAAGVESCREAEWLASAGIDEAQGFHYGRPVYRPRAALPESVSQAA
jgi:EAL domain-containing protein (putative c-di-GMP-specific phosphodiesterase class I)